jgi:hypothetical protein
MCMLTFDYPQTYAVTGSAEEQLAQLRSYIWQLVDVLNQADDGNEAGIGAADTAALRTELEKLRKALRDLEAKSGHGLPSGGTAGQTLTKLSESDYDTGWRTPAGGGSGGGVDYVTEQGLTGKWTWRKWASGIAEMWATFGTDKLTIDEAWGSLYFGTWMRSDANVSARKYPFAFADTPTISATYMGGGLDAWLVSLFNANDDLLTGAPAYALARPNTATILTPRISYHVVGKYK